MEKLIQLINDVMTQAQKLCSTMQSATVYANNITREADAKLKKAADRELVAEDKEKEISERAAKIAKVENLVALEAEGKKLAEENKVSTAKLEQALIAFNAELARKTKTLVAAEQKASNENEMIAKEWAALRKEQESWKAKWLEEVKNKVK